MKTYDTLVVGTGRYRGMAAKVLTEHGLEVLLLESGIAVKPSQFKTHAMPFHFPFRGVGSPKAIRRMAATRLRSTLPSGLLCRIQQASLRYTFRSALGLVLAVENSWRPNGCIWGPAILSAGGVHFKAASIDGYGANWPFSYQDLEGYYDKVRNTLVYRGDAKDFLRSPMASSSRLSISIVMNIDAKGGGQEAMAHDFVANSATQPPAPQGVPRAIVVEFAGTAAMSAHSFPHPP